MTKPKPKAPMSNGIVYVVCGTVAFCFLVACGTAIFVAVPQGARTGSMVTVIFGALASTIAAVAALLNSMRTGRQTTEVGGHVAELKNGLMDAKIRTGIADVLPDHLIDPAVLAQLERDRQRVQDSGGHVATRVKPERTRKSGIRK